MLKSIPHHLRPREKFIQQGPQSLTDAELLALFFRTGVQGCSAIELAQQLINQHQNISTILKLDVDEFCQIKGLGSSKFIQLQAAKEIIGRCQHEDLQQMPIFEQPQQVKDFLYSKMAFLPREEFAVLFLDNQHKLIKFMTLFQGSINQAQVYPRELAKIALQLNASAVILTHNHPSGVAEPSIHDIELTGHIKKALALLEIRVLDHLIVAGQICVSLAERGEL